MHAVARGAPQSARGARGAKTNAREVRDHAVMQGASAERIVFIGADDLGRPEMLERTARVVESFRAPNRLTD
jgi:hypothetical protein